MYQQSTHEPESMPLLSSVSSVISVVTLLMLVGLGGCMTLDRHVPRTASSALSETEIQATALGQTWAATATEDAALSAFRLLPSSLEAFAARIALVDRAERTLDLQYYIFHTDDTGQLLIDHLLQAADRGVRVRLLVDDMYTHGIEKGLVAFDGHANIELRIFNPWTQRSGKFIRGIEFLFSPSLNHRMHNKMFIADGVVAILGGRNIGDEYFDLNPNFEFRDLDVGCFGPVAGEASRLFDEFWNGADAIPVTGFKPMPDVEGMLAAARTRLSAHREHMHDSPYAAAMRSTEFVQQLQSKSMEWVFARGHVVGDSPTKAEGDAEGGAEANSDGDAEGDDMADDGEESADSNEEPTLADQLRDAFYSAKREFIISSPYFVPGKNVTSRLCAQAAGGIDVRILTNSLAANDVPIAHAYYAKYRKDLARGGVHLFELRKSSAAAEARKSGLHYGSVNASLHAKSFVVDRERVFIGSLNLDPRSVVINTEVGVLIESPQIAGSVADSITRLMGPEWSYRVTVSDEGKLIWIGEDAGGKEIRLTTDPDTSWWDRFKADLMRLLPLESQS